MHVSILIKLINALLMVPQNFSTKQLAFREVFLIKDK